MIIVPDTIWGPFWFGCAVRLVAADDLGAAGYSGTGVPLRPTSGDYTREGSRIFRLYPITYCPCAGTWRPMRLYSQHARLFAGSYGQERILRTQIGQTLSMWLRQLSPRSVTRRMWMVFWRKPPRRAQNQPSVGIQRPLRSETSASRRDSVTILREKTALALGVPFATRVVFAKALTTVA